MKCRVMKKLSFTLKITSPLIYSQNTVKCLMRFLGNYFEFRATPEEGRTYYRKVGYSKTFCILPKHLAKDGVLEKRPWNRAVDYAI